MNSLYSLSRRSSPASILPRVVRMQRTGQCLYYKFYHEVDILHARRKQLLPRLSPVSTKSRLCHKLSDNIIPATLVVRLLSTPGELYTLIIVYINYDTLPERDFHSRLPLLASLALYPFTHATTYDVLPLVHSNTLGFNSPLGARGYKCQVPL